MRAVQAEVSPQGMSRGHVPITSPRSTSAPQQARWSQAENPGRGVTDSVLHRRTSHGDQASIPHTQHRAGRWSWGQAGRERGPWLPPATALTLLGKAEEVGEEPPDAPERELGSCEDQRYPRRSCAVSHRASHTASPSDHKWPSARTCHRAQGGNPRSPVGIWAGLPQPSAGPHDPRTQAAY